jgi:hypothetical protein
MSKGGDFKAVEGSAGRLVERFLKASGYTFECSAITGRTFTNVADHASYLQGGGCARILEALGTAHGQ